MPVGDCFRTPLAAAVLLAAPAMFIAACGSSGSSNQGHTVPSGSGGGLGSSTPATSPSGGKPGIVAVTTAGAPVRLDPSSGSAGQTPAPTGGLRRGDSAGPG